MSSSCRWSCKARSNSNFSYRLSISRGWRLFPRPRISTLRCRVFIFTCRLRAVLKSTSPLCRSTNTRCCGSMWRGLRRRSTVRRYGLLSQDWRRLVAVRWGSSGTEGNGRENLAQQVPAASSASFLCTTMDFKALRLSLDGMLINLLLAK